MTCPAAHVVLLAIAVALAADDRLAAEITAQRCERGVVIQIDGKPFAEYLVDFRGTPIVWPIIGPTGQPMTRAYPMGEGPNEKKDHPHHRSLWFTHGDVNGVSFWDKAAIKHREFTKVEGGPRAVVVTRNDWLGPDGKPLLEDERTLTFAADAAARWIDFDVTLKALDAPVKFGDTKEGTMAVRVAETMKVDAKLGGRIVNSDGLTDGAAWGKRAAWVDYHGPVEGQTVGIAMFNHPSSFRFTTYWHVRTYGLFAANPFGVHDFVKGEGSGAHTLAPGEAISLRYRLFLHRGDEKAGKVAEAFGAYAREGK